MSTAIYTPSRQRTDMAARTLSPAVEHSDHPIYLVVDPSERSVYEDMLEDNLLSDRVSVVCPKKNGKGIGHARTVALAHATKQGYSDIILNDDDCILLEGAADLLLEASAQARESGYAGVGAWHRILNHFCGIEKGTGIHAQTGSMGVRTFAINVETANEIGGFDDQFRTNYEDYELVLRCILAGVGPWLIHSDAEVQQVGKRYQAGGISSLSEDNASSELKMATRFAKKHPDYVSVTAKGKARVSWMKAYKSAGFDWPLDLNPPLEDWEF